MRIKSELFLATDLLKQDKKRKDNDQISTELQSKL